MSRKILLAVLLIFPFFPAMAQEARTAGTKEPVFFFAPLAEVSLYNIEKPAIGGGFIIGADGKVSIGLCSVYFHEVHISTLNKRILALETTLFLRVYVLRDKTDTGLFAQFNFGPFLLFAEDDISIPARSGISSAFLSLGWRFPLGRYLFVEPSIKAGYPFIVGANLALGVRL